MRHMMCEEACGYTVKTPKSPPSPYLGFTFPAQVVWESTPSFPVAVQPSWAQAK